MFLKPFNSERTLTPRRVDLFVLVVFALVYLGMILGEIPGLALDRTGVALLGAIALLAAGRLTLAAAGGRRRADARAALRPHGGLGAVPPGRVLRRVDAAHRRGTASPTRCSRCVIVAAGALSAVLANDIVCLAMAPVLVEVCARRRLDPVPFLLALACAANVGSAATLIGNPQNMLIGADAASSRSRATCWTAASPACSASRDVWR